jgi:predicted enzyme related to lactoylglutathione lyase
MDEVPPHLFGHSAVEDANASAAVARAAGGQIRRESYEASGIARITIPADPTGAVIELMKPTARER